MTRHYVDSDGNYLGGFDGKVANEDGEMVDSAPENGTEVPAAPEHGLDTWDGSKWVAHTPNLEFLMGPSESIDIVARKLEEIIDNVANGTPLSQHTIDWMQNRKDLR